MCFRPCKPSQWQQSLKIQVFLWLFFAREEALLCGAHQTRVSKGVIKMLRQGGNGSEGYWSVQMAVTVWWGLSKSGRERKNGVRNNKNAHLHTLQNAFLLSWNPGMGGLPGELRVHPSSYQFALSTGSHLRNTPLPQYHAENWPHHTNTGAYTHLKWPVYVGVFEISASVSSSISGSPGTVPGNKRPGLLTARKYETVNITLSGKN